jgi:Tfp pilus assembly protein PilO
MPLPWHAGAAAFAVLCVAGLCFFWYGHVAQSSIKARASLTEAQTQLRAAESAAMPSTLTPKMTLLDAGRLDEVVRDISRFAAQHSIRVGSLRVEHAPTGGIYGQVQFNISARGNYGELKAWLSELLARYPSVALKSLALQAPAQGASQVGATLSLLVYLKPAR